MRSKTKMATTSNRFACIDSPQGKFVAQINENGSYHHQRAEVFLFDGKHPEPTNNERWYKVEKIPTLVQVVIPSKRVNRRYVRIKEFSSIEHLPEIITLDEWGCDNKYGGFEAMYELVYDTEPESFKSVDFTLQMRREGTFSLPNNNLGIAPCLVPSITEPEFAQHMRPCFLSSSVLYEIVRDHIKKHIDHEYAQITSDYNFCLTVEKRIPYTKPIPYQTDLNKAKRTKRKKIETRLRRTESVPVFKMTHSKEKYKGYPVLPNLVAESHEKLIAVLEEFLEVLMSTINEPIKMCECCGGTGVNPPEVNSTLKQYTKFLEWEDE